LYAPCKSLLKHKNIRHTFDKIPVSIIGNGVNDYGLNFLVNRQKKVTEMSTAIFLCKTEFLMIKISVLDDVKKYVKKIATFSFHEKYYKYSK